MKMLCIFASSLLSVLLLTSYSKNEEYTGRVHFNTNVTGQKGIQTKTKTKTNSASNADPGHQYAVGDIYPHVGTAVGVVYDVTHYGRHGKIVCLDEKNYIQWADVKSVTGATNWINGAKNMKIIYGINSTLSGYPAFKWSYDKNSASEPFIDAMLTGGVWYLPSYEELYTLYTVVGTVNTGLLLVGGTPLSTSVYWSSTEYNFTGSWGVNFRHGTTNSYDKTTFRKVRCILAF